MAIISEKIKRKEDAVRVVIRSDYCIVVSRIYCSSSGQRIADHAAAAAAAAAAVARIIRNRQATASVSSR